MTRATYTAALALVLCAAAAGSASAQPAGSTGTLEVAGGGLYMMRMPLASGDATETTSTRDSFRLFTTSTTLAAAASAEIVVGYFLRPGLEVFGAASYGRRQLRISASNDAENATPVTASERLEQFTFSGGALWFLSQSKYAPFVRAEAGQLRYLHEAKSLVETGIVGMFGGGVQMRLATRGTSDRAMGLRIDGRGVARSNGFLLEGKRVTAAAGVSVFIQF